MPSDTAAVLGQQAEKCQSRSLFCDRFADPAAREQARKHWFSQLIRKNPEAISLQARQDFLAAIKTSPTNLLYAQLQARLMVNMAGGVMENAGLCLDRFGMPYIPGSAVKGCARRAALAALHDWPSSNQKPGNDHPLASAYDSSFASPAQMLATVALVFGWCEQDWKQDSDFGWACPDEQTRRDAAELLAGKLNQKIEEKQKQTPWKVLPNFAGLISFLPAYAVDLGRTGVIDGLPHPVPSPGKLELDVVTCHHPEYYSGKKPIATDTEDPNPVVFPAVAPGHVFAFALLPLPRAGRSLAQIQWDQTQLKLLEIARNWLAAGLAVFGLGAKTNAGYGWFDTSSNIQTIASNALVEAEKHRQEQTRIRQEAERHEAAQAEQQRRAAEIKAATANMTPEQKLDYQIAHLTQEQFRGWLNSFLKRNEEEQKAIVRALRLPPEDKASRRSFWEDLKNKASKGGDSARVKEAIHKLSKKMYPGKESKMP
ncbi:MAG: type III-B CRISPR module RAMP protein Cmr6 [Verrucomicrobiae bacterium]|nr:type III-B CRISPR module RAMP protein Cmr6 [Verrucomicrobiae bacterium]